MSSLTNNCECPICMEPMSCLNCTTTECGHAFHSSCIFKNLTITLDCPLCRKALVEVAEDQDGSDGDDDEYEDEDEDNTDEEDEEPVEIKFTINQIYDSLKKRGFTEIDFLALILEQCPEVKNTEEIEEKRTKLLDCIESIIDGEIQVDHRDSRSYAEVVSATITTTTTTTAPEI